MQFSRLSEQIIYSLSKKEIDGRIRDSYFYYRQNRPVEELRDLSRFGKFKDIIQKFESVFKKSFPQTSYDSMIYLLNRLEIQDGFDSNYPTKWKKSMGLYDSIHNRILLRNKQDLSISLEELLIHELLHMASTKKVRDDYLTGFEISGIVGYGLNEGYTEYLTQKYFIRGSRYTEVDDNKVFLAKGIENIVGEEKMQEYFLDANLGGLVRELSKYARREDIMKILFLMDHLDNPLSASKNMRILTREIAKINDSKLKIDLDAGNITQEQYDIQHAIKVDEYLRHHLWSEKVRVIKDKESFLLEENRWTSDVYDFTPPPEKPKENEKIYQE